MTTEGTAKLILTIGHSWIDFTADVVTFDVTINGYAMRKICGDHEFDVVPGEYEVIISYSWFPWKQRGKASARFSVVAGERVALKYKMPNFRFLRGKMKVVRNA